MNTNLLANRDEARTATLRFCLRIAAVVALEAITVFAFDCYLNAPTVAIAALAIISLAAAAVVVRHKQIGVALQALFVGYLVVRAFVDAATLGHSDQELFARVSISIAFGIAVGFLANEDRQRAVIEATPLPGYPTHG